MRRSLLPGLARALAFNIARGRANLRLFEVATIHQRDEQGRPVERRAAAIGVSGLAALVSCPGRSFHQPPALPDPLRYVSTPSTGGHSGNKGEAGADRYR